MSRSSELLKNRHRELHTVLDGILSPQLGITSRLFVEASASKYLPLLVR